MVEVAPQTDTATRWSPGREYTVRKIPERRAESTGAPRLRGATVSGPPTSAKNQGVFERSRNRVSKGSGRWRGRQAFAGVGQRVEVEGGERREGPGQRREGAMMRAGARTERRKHLARLFTRALRALWRQERRLSGSLHIPSSAGRLPAVPGRGC